MTSSYVLQTPVGAVTVVASDRAITAIRFGGELGAGVPPTPLLCAAVEQLNAYFRGERKSFSLPLCVEGGTPFQRAVWQALQTIPYGETRTYGAIAAQIGAPRAVRAVGSACNRNPIAIVVPCHRVVGAGGALTGFAAGIATKAALLSLEEAMSSR